MKKLLYSIIALTGLAFASCTQEHIDVQYNPENAVAPVLGAIEGCELSDGGADIVVEYTKADFGVATANAHNLYISKSEDMADMKKAKAAFADATITLTQADLNVVALDLAEAGAEVDLYFAVVANLNTDKGAAVAGSDLMSNVVKATFKSYVADVLPSEKFDKMYVVGTLNGWDHPTVAKEFDFLYNYDAGNSNLYAGIIDLRTPESAAEFKFTDAGGWGSKEHSMTGENAAEASTVTLVAGGGDNINVWQTKRFYGAELDLGGLTLKKLWSADQIGIIGLNGDWETDIVMEYNAKWTRFYADIEAAEATEMKFRADAAWDINWGVDCAMGGGNIPVAAGQYRVYFNPVTGLIEFNAKNYGTEEDTGAGTTPEPEPTETTYGLIGDFNGWGEPDVDLVARGDGWYVTTALEVGADGKFLIRLNDAWSNKFGFAEADTFVTVDAKNALTAEGQDMWIAAGTYDFYFNPEASELYVMTAGAADPTLPSDAKAVKLYAHKEGTAWAEMALYGWDGYDFGAWPGILLTEKETIDGKEFFVYEFPVSAYGITTNIIFNNNNKGEQTQDITGVVLNRDYYYIIPAEAENGKFMAYEMGTEPVKPVEPSFPVLTEHSWGVIGTFNGWAGDVAMEIVDGVATATIEIADTDNERKFKVRADSAWTNNFGYSATEEAPLAPVDGTEFAATFNGSDIVVEAAGKYEVALRIENEQGYLKITKL